MNVFLERCPPGYVEVLGSLGVQAGYFACGIIMEKMRPAYVTATSREVLNKSLLNHVILNSLHFAIATCMGGNSILSQGYPKKYQLPSWTELISQLVIGLVLRDAVFWLIHRLLHVPGLYLVHAKHHEIKNPGEHHVFTISYMSVADFFFLYAVPIVSVAKFLDMKLIATLAFSFISATGEQVKLVWGDEAHDEHHVNGAVNFGAYGPMDWICGTSGQWFLVKISCPDA
ncbi:fatty acid hydroxylase superfamily protein [Colletotrichum fioriniae PJ7]|uniref:Fatty acid hydroxylase superfamily protein n=1 Tax=Colletotrichum fioriniae PJ7 TaxID=1445577 RepID=A0A010QRR8_9PEZI|nr:fatty acid hydroxylase superfamily protein [Colletotrichum fioriniae PJ7]